MLLFYWKKWVLHSTLLLVSSVSLSFPELTVSLVTVCFLLIVLYITCHPWSMPLFLETKRTTSTTTTNSITKDTTKQLSLIISLEKFSRTLVLLWEQANSSAFWLSRLLLLPLFLKKENHHFDYVCISSLPVLIHWFPRRDPRFRPKRQHSSSLFCLSHWLLLFVCFHWGIRCQGILSTSIFFTLVCHFQTPRHTFIVIESNNQNNITTLPWKSMSGEWTRWGPIFSQQPN